MEENNMAQRSDVYLFGQILGTHSFLLKDGFLRPDGYMVEHSDAGRGAGIIVM